MCERERMLTFCRTDNVEELMQSVCLSVCMFMCQCVNIITHISFPSAFIKFSALIPHCIRKTIVSSWSDVNCNADPGYRLLLSLCLGAISF